MPRRQHTAVDQLRCLARPARYRVSMDPEGLPLIPGRYGRIEWFNGRDLAGVLGPSTLLCQALGDLRRPPPPDRGPGDAGHLPTRGARAGGGRHPS
jgi:hypothetical protein